MRRLVLIAVSLSACGANPAPTTVVPAAVEAPPVESPAVADAPRQRSPWGEHEATRKPGRRTPAAFSRTEAMGRADSLPGVEKLPLEELWEALFYFFHAYGYLCRPGQNGQGNPLESGEAWGVRFVLDGVRQARELQGLLQQAAYPPGEMVRRHGKWMVRVPGQEAVELIAELWAELGLGRRGSAAQGAHADQLRK